MEKPVFRKLLFDSKSLQASGPVPSDRRAALQPPAAPSDPARPASPASANASSLWSAHAQPRSPCTLHHEDWPRNKEWLHPLVSLSGRSAVCDLSWNTHKVSID